MRTMVRTRVLAIVATGGLLAAAAASAQPLTVERAVQMALERSTAAVNAEADVLSARGGLYQSYAGLLPSVTGSVTRSGSWEQNSSGASQFGTNVFPIVRNDSERYSTSPTLSGRWAVLDLEAYSTVRSAQNNLQAARLRRTASDLDVVLATKRQFYEVVKAVKLAEVAAGALRLATDDERRVNALFEVGSVSRSDLLKARVRTAQSELDSLNAWQAVTVQRILLARQLGVREAELGEVDTVLAATANRFEEGAVLQEAAAKRPDVQAAEKSLRAAEASLRAANFRRLPYLTVQGSATFDPRSTTKTTTLEASLDSNGDPVPAGYERGSLSESDLSYGASVSLNLDLFTGLSTEGGIASARAQVMRAREARDALRRNLADEVHQSILTHRQAVESDRVAQRALESAVESLKLTQQKYNVGSATILDLIDAQVQLQRAQGDGVTARAAIRVAEAQIERVRGGAR